MWYIGDTHSRGHKIPNTGVLSAGSFGEVPLPRLLPPVFALYLLFSPDYLDKFHPLQLYLKRLPRYLSERSYERRLRLAISDFVRSLFPVRLRLLANPLKSSAKLLTILIWINAKEIPTVSIRSETWCNASFLVGQSIISCNHTLSISNDLPYE